tara:strand:- start:666 stop:821 length:156 start_codon:yes stop_codon:yes gene_type:complete
MSWAYKSHRGEAKKSAQKKADPWLYMGKGLYMKVSEFYERYEKRSKNASKV